MPRNASGTYSLPAGNPVVAGTLITDTWGNTTLDDIKTEMTDSLDRSGKGGMLAPLQLSNGSVGVPALTFAVEPSTGLYRPAANQLGFSLAGAQQLKLSTTAPAFLATSPLAAADAGTDFVLDTTNARTAGNLLTVATGGTLKFSMTADGRVFLVNGQVIASPANVGLVLFGNKNAADAGTDLLVSSQATRTAGLLFEVDNAGPGAMLQVGYRGDLWLGDGALSAAGPVVQPKAASGKSLTLKGNLTAADAGADIIADTSVARTAGNVFAMRNNGSTVASVDWLGRANFNAGGLILESVAAQVYTAKTNTTLTLLGNRSAADAGTDIILNSTVTRTSGNLLAVQNNGVDECDVGPGGEVQSRNGLFATFGSNTSATLRGNRSAADAGTDIILNSTVTRTSGNLLDVQNSGSSKLLVSFIGAVNLGGGNGAVVALGATAANTGLILSGNKNAADTGADVFLASSVTRTAGDLLQVVNNATPKFGLDFNGEPDVQGGLACGVGLKTDADQTESAGTFTNVTGMSFPVVASGIYEWEVLLGGNLSGATPNWSYDFTGPAAPISVSYSHGSTIVAATAFSSAKQLTATAQEFVGVFTGRLVNGANAGTVQMRFAMGGTAGTATARKGAILRWRRIG